MTSLVAYLLKRLTYATNSLICASESFFLKAGILSRPLLIELKRRSSVTSFCQAASVRSRAWTDRKSTRLNSSHSQISYAVFCLKKRNNQPAMPDSLTRIIDLRLLGVDAALHRMTRTATRSLRISRLARDADYNRIEIRATSPDS